MAKHRRCMSFWEKVLGDELYDFEIHDFCEVCQPRELAMRRSIIEVDKMVDRARALSELDNDYKNAIDRLNNLNNQ